MAKPRIDPVRWAPPKAPVVPDSLPPLRMIPVHGTGPEDVVADEDGRLYTGVQDGRVLRVSAPFSDGRHVETIADTGGRPLGIELYDDDRLLVCDARRGLLLVRRDTGAVEVLATTAAGKPINVCNNAAVASDGTVLFTDSSQRFPLERHQADLLEHSGTGRLLRRAPGGEIDVLLDGLHFANGVALAPDESCVFVAETGAFRLRRVWLTGDRAGHTEMFAENLPGVPDNATTGSDGLIWVAHVTERVRALDVLLPLPPIVRKVVWALPDALHPAAARRFGVQAYDVDGRCVHQLFGTADGFHMATGVRERDGTLYLGSLSERAIATLPVPGVS